MLRQNIDVGFGIEVVLTNSLEESRGAELSQHSLLSITCARIRRAYHTHDLYRYGRPMAYLPLTRGPR